MADDVIATQLDNSRDLYTFFVPEEARWSKVRHLKTNVGSSYYHLTDRILKLEFGQLVSDTRVAAESTMV